MKHAIPRGRTRRLIMVAAPVLALAAGALTVTSVANADKSASAPAEIGLDEYYINYSEPAVQPETRGKEVKGQGGIFGPAVGQGPDLRP